MLLFKKVMFNKIHNFNLIASLNMHMETSHGTPLIYTILWFGVLSVNCMLMCSITSTKDEYI